MKPGEQDRLIDMLLQDAECIRHNGNVPPEWADDCMTAAATIDQQQATIRQQKELLKGCESMLVMVTDNHDLCGGCKKLIIGTLTKLRAALSDRRE